MHTSIQKVVSSANKISNLKNEISFLKVQNEKLIENQNKDENLKLELKKTTQDWEIVIEDSEKYHYFCYLIYI